MADITIGNTVISASNDKCFMIGEAGSNHDGSRTNAYELIDVAAASGADAVKFQLFKAETLYSEVVGQETIQSVRRAELPPDWVPELMDRCKSKRITFLATPFDYDSVDYLVGLGVPAIKWASGEITDLDLLGYAARKEKPLLISTGMCNLSDVENAVDVVRRQGNDDIVLMHCISLYPTPVHLANLRMMDTLRNSFGYVTGFSDHTMGTSIALAAVARGARVLEKHFTLDKNLASPDHPFSLRPGEFATLVKGIRDISDSLGHPTKSMLEEEKAVARIAKRSIIARTTIAKGSRITSSELIVKRPGYGLPPSLLSTIIGRIAKRDIKRDEPLTWDMIE